MVTEKIKSLLKGWESEWNKGAQVWKRFVRVCWELDNKPMVELESFRTVVKKLQELEAENKKLKERINELEATNKKRTADNWATFKS